MKRQDLIRHVEQHGCYFEREGGNYTIYRNPANGYTTGIPRHRKIKNSLARAICDQLGIPRPAPRVREEEETYGYELS